MSGAVLAFETLAIRQRCLAEICKIVGGASVRDLHDAMRFDALGADSIDRVTLQFWAEEEFGIHIADDEAMGIDTIGGLVALVDAKVRGRIC